jgi:hypothetical protein
MDRDAPLARIPRYGTPGYAARRKCQRFKTRATTWYAHFARRLRAVLDVMEYQ